MGEHSGNHAERALLDYFDALLHDGGESPAPAPAPDAGASVLTLAAARAARPARVVEPLQTFTEPRPFAEPVRPLRVPLPAPAAVGVEAPAPVAAPATPEPARVVEAVVEAPPATAVETAATPAPAWATNGRPHWAQQPFECLLFKSGGLTLAAPLVELGSIYPLEADAIAGIFGQIDWFLGLMQTKYGSVRVVDSARVVMPERYAAAMAQGYRFVLTLDASDWGLGVDAIVGTALLDPDAVKWRGERSRRPWLAGTVIDRMCALLDVAQMRRMFDETDRRRSPAADRSPSTADRSPSGVEGG